MLGIYLYPSGGYYNYVLKLLRTSKWPKNSVTRINSYEHTSKYVSIGGIYLDTRTESRAG